LKVDASGDKLGGGERGWRIYNSDAGRENGADEFGLAWREQKGNIETDALWGVVDIK